MARIVDNSKILARANEALERANYDYAIELFMQVVKSDPDDIKARMGLRNAEKSKFERKGKGFGARLGGALAGLPALLSAWVLMLFKKFDGATMKYEKYLARDPFSPFVLGQLATALDKRGSPDSALVTLEFLRQIRPNHLNTLRRLAHMYIERKDIQRAMQRYQIVLQYRPNDIEASRQMHDLAATESIQEGWEEGGSFQEKVRDRDQATRLEQNQHIVRTADQATDAVERVKADIQEDPENPVLWSELGDLNRRRGAYPEATEAYEKALELDPRNQLYLQKLMDTRLLQFDGRIEEAGKAARAAPEDEALKRNVAAAEKEKQDFWLGEAKRRAEERPTDTGLRYELGTVYFTNGMINQATAEFQRVVRDPKFRVSATTMLGKCFALKGLDELAIEQFEKALGESSLQEEPGKEIAYNLGVLYEKVGNLAAAEEAYKRLFEIDIGYRDIAEKMERIYRKRREKKSTSNSEGD